MSSVKPRWCFALMLCFARVAKEHRRKICKLRVWWRRYFSCRPATWACRRELVDGGGEAIDTTSGHPSAWKWLHHSKVSSNFIELVSTTDRKPWSQLWLFSSWAKRATTCKIGLHLLRFLQHDRTVARAQKQHLCLSRKKGKLKLNICWSSINNNKIESFHAYFMRILKSCVV